MNYLINGQLMMERWVEAFLEEEEVEQLHQQVWQLLQLNW
jgi:hypothetical protein